MGDLHEIGKNIVKLMLETQFFEVKDLGVSVDPVNFIREAEAMGAQVIGASSLMTTTMPHQKEIVSLLKDKGLRAKYKVVVGGAPVNQKWAEEIGADLVQPGCRHRPADDRRPVEIQVAKENVTCPVHTACGRSRTAPTPVRSARRTTSCPRSSPRS